ncbi:hypothetical protein GYMLUDRAFT_245554 [Collybiopsis luxurians FD-317 M1]|uniref:Uncharacterized protein n=1 Tax=Collybiopsis luxurians FD-317 M1 TaxID=944289 RepID=A0A0D0CTN5_9AGAR|nr:hypothetical protein GYMLUDRAFT_245554 [Collybiopsis luxurians FD-317 M1]
MPSSSSSAITSYSSSSSTKCLQLKNKRLQCENVLLQARFAQAIEDNAQLAEQCDAADAHAIIAGQQFSVYKYRFNKKTKKKEASKWVQTSEWVLTSKSGEKEIREKNTKKVQAQNEKVQKKRNANDLQFSGNIKQLNKSDLIDIAFSLKISYKGASKNVLCVPLNAHFEANQDLKKHPHYVSLFE